MNLTANQTEVLNLIRDRGASGISIRYVWTFQSAGRVITREVKALERKGLVEISYYTGSAGVNLTEAGRVAS